jgi:hypothetical protein
VVAAGPEIPLEVELVALVVRVAAVLEQAQAPLEHQGQRTLEAVEEDQQVRLPPARVMVEMAVLVSL